MSNTQFWLAVLIPILFNGALIALLNMRIDDLKKHMDLKIDNAFTHMELLLKLHEAEHHKK